MKTLTATKRLLVLILAPIFVLSCSNDDDAPFVPTNSLVEIVQATPQLSSLETALLKYPDLINTLSGNGNFTVFAPDNDAFDALLAAIGQSSIDDIPENVLRNVLEYHVYASATLTSNLVGPGDLQMVNGETATITSDNTGVFIAGAKIIGIDALGTNGVAHIISNVMVPPSIAPIVGTIVAPAYFNKDFTTLIAAVENANTDVLSVLLGNGPSGNGLTLFAPTNAAFEAAGITDVNGADAVLTYHVVDGTVNKDDLPTTSGSAIAIPTLGGNFYLTNAGNGVMINGSTMVTSTDISGSNGVVHVIDRVLLPPTQTINEIVAEFAGGNPGEFTLLATALQRAGLGDTFGTAGPFTVFAPTDAAFLAAGLDADVINSTDPAAVAGILTHHVVKASAYVFSGDLVTGDVEMLNDQNVGIDVSALTVQDAAMSSPAASLVPSLLNVLATNGVVHVIDKVLLPATP
ncbi:fasciclin domain-containing protein [Seonamhaeicola aphaedonensis]|uniref:Transforming growth factor-beta-induced protein n=1 Tax=Seonamhaeicola aphaedonensis TaxID=1461338 RepID=A0A3D9HDQ5_9FLAO|nr:fasciclin domain-containing protein [Seonamhaeicola aphaedonensis]RED47609.1 transforming growth factor-beta-induced protein [Seonamhaeicola aphaedonensis]